MTEKQYEKLVEEMSPKSPMGWDCVAAFVVGGAICTVGQLLIDLTKLTPAQSAVRKIAPRLCGS